MLLLIIGLILGVLLYNHAPRLEGAAKANTSVCAYVDEKRVDSYVKED